MTPDICCTGRAMQGTSMATPLVAASATLVRQYFLDGFYPSGAATANNVHAPSGPLVKVSLSLWQCMAGPWAAVGLQLVILMMAGGLQGSGCLTGYHASWDCVLGLQLLTASMVQLLRVRPAAAAAAQWHRTHLQLGDS